MVGALGAVSGGTADLAVLLAFVADAFAVVVAVFAGDAEGGVAVAVEAHGLDAADAGRRNNAVVGCTLLA